MQEITAETAVQYLRESRFVSREAAIHVRELSGGVSNLVLKVDIPGQPSFVIKQCRERLRVATEWRVSLERIWVESSTLDLLGSILPMGSVPTLLFEDRPNYLFAMTCAPADSSTWKSRLLAGEVDHSVAANLGELLGLIHAKAPSIPLLHEQLADRKLFEELRVDPYYRTTSRAHPDLAPSIESLISNMENLPVKERTLVLGDFSPKNILVHSKGLILLDFECAHRGDPTFDLGFFFSHLILKSILLGRDNRSMSRDYLALADDFWNSYLETIGTAAPFAARIVPRAIAHTAACLLARVDGKSPVEYLDSTGQKIARGLATDLLYSPPETWDDLVGRVQRS